MATMRIRTRGPNEVDLTEIDKQYLLLPEEVPHAKEFHLKLQSVEEEEMNRKRGQLKYLFSLRLKSSDKSKKREEEEAEESSTCAVCLGRISGHCKSMIRKKHKRRNMCLFLTSYWLRAF